MFFIISSNDIPHNISSEVYLSILLTKKHHLYLPFLIFSPKFGIFLLEKPINEVLLAEYIEILDLFTF